MKPWYAQYEMSKILDWIYLGNVYHAMELAYNGNPLGIPEQVKDLLDGWTSDNTNSRFNCNEHNQHVIEAFRRGELSRNTRTNNIVYILGIVTSGGLEPAIASLQLPLNLDNNLVGSARTSLLNKKLYNWREFSKNVGAVVSKHLILKIAADEIRNGNKPKLAYVAKGVFLEGITPIDVDTLLRLRLLRGY